MGRSAKSLWERGAKMIGEFDTISMIEAANEVYIRTNVVSLL